MARLTRLSDLMVDELRPQDARRGLQVLTGLSRLQRLHGFEEAGQEALGAFWDRVRSQQHE